jgi:hypothetical protein
MKTGRDHECSQASQMSARKDTLSKIKRNRRQCGRVVFLFIIIIIIIAAAVEAARFFFDTHFSGLPRHHP